MVSSLALLGESISDFHEMCPWLQCIQKLSLIFFYFQKYTSDLSVYFYLLHILLLNVHDTSVLGMYILRLKCNACVTTVASLVIHWTLSYSSELMECLWDWGTLVCIVLLWRVRNQLFFEKPAGEKLPLRLWHLWVFLFSSAST